MNLILSEVRNSIYENLRQKKIKEAQSKLVATQNRIKAFLSNDLKDGQTPLKEKEVINNSTTKHIEKFYFANKPFLDSSNLFRHRFCIDELQKLNPHPSSTQKKILRMNSACNFVEENLCEINSFLLLNHKEIFKQIQNKEKAIRRPNADNAVVEGDDQPLEIDFNYNKKKSNGQVVRIETYVDVR